MKLYFIAIIPPEAVEQQIHLVKTEFAEKYQSKKALKLPAHITLIPPFRFSEKKEQAISEILHSFALKQKPFKIFLENFGAFPQHNIHIMVKNHEPVKELHQELKKIMVDNLGNKNQKNEDSFHPHITIAFRDLERDLFPKAWKEFQNRDFSTYFEAKNIFLLKHNGKTWDIFKTYKFQKKD